MINANIIEKRLKDNGYKLTNQRKAIIEVLFENQNHLISAEDIFLECKKKGIQTNFSTVYRNLEVLENTGIVSKTNITGSSSSYELSCLGSHHHHLICKICGKVDVIDFCPMADALKCTLDDKDFTLTDHKFELYGYCKNCKGKDAR